MLELLIYIIKELIYHLQVQQRYLQIIPSVGDGFQFMHLNQEILRLGNDGDYTANFSANITASGNISASGTIVANKIEAVSLVSHAGDANTGLQFGSDTVSIEGNDVIAAAFKSKEIELNLPVTASSNISASGHISASNIHIVDSTAVCYCVCCNFS